MLRAKPWRPIPKRAYKPRDPQVTSAMMSAVRGRDNVAEVGLRRELWRRGFRYRLHERRFVGRPDICFISRRVLLFVDGDFWHGRGLVQDGVEAFIRTIRTRRRRWWLRKIARNVDRDREVTRLLRKQGWRVIRLWESEVLRDVRRAADRVERAITRPKHPVGRHHVR